MKYTYELKKNKNCEKKKTVKCERRLTLQAQTNLTGKVTCPPTTATTPDGG